MTAFAAWRTLDDDVATDQKGSQVAVGQPRVDFITGTAGIGQQEPFGVREISILNVRFGERMLISDESRSSAGTC